MEITTMNNKYGKNGMAVSSVLFFVIANFCPQVFWVGRKVHFCKYFSQLQFTLCFPQSFMLLYEEGCFLKNQKSLQPICTCNFFWCARLNHPVCACTNGQGNIVTDRMCSLRSCKYGEDEARAELLFDYYL